MRPIRFFFKHKIKTMKTILSIENRNAVRRMAIFSNKKDHLKGLINRI
jgi:hypothetical protein